MTLDPSTVSDVFKAVIPPAIITVLGLLLTWFIGLRFVTQWNIRQKQRELDFSAAEQFRNLYGEFVMIWRLWHATKHTIMKDPSETEKRRWDLYSRACSAEGRVEGILMKLALERHLTAHDIGVLGTFRQGYQQLREYIQDDAKIDWGHAISKGYGLFKYLSSQVGVMLSSNDQRKPPPPKIASENLEAIMSSRWEEAWKQPSRDEAISCMKQQVALLKQPIPHT
jgi:hypothetical protein